MDVLLLFGLHASEAGNVQNLSATFCILPNTFQNEILNSVTDVMARKPYCLYTLFIAGSGKPVY